MGKNVGKLRDRASALVNKGKYAKALDTYLELEQADGKNGDWARRAADMYRRLDREEEEALALGRAADKYAKAGFLVKAVAVCKMILQDHPDDSAALQRLAELQSARGMPAVRRELAKARTLPPDASVAPPPATEASGELELMPVTPPPTPAELPAIELDLEENTPLDQLSLGAVIPDSRSRRLPDGAVSGITMIPLDDEDIVEIDDLDLVLEDGLDEDEAAEIREALVRMAETPLLSALSPEALQQVTDELDVIDLDAGAALFHHGDRGNTLYVVVEGEVAVVVEGPPRVQLSTLGEGQFFGEIALVTDQPRSATIEATVDTQLLAIDRDVIRNLIRREPAVLKVLLRFLRDRLLDTLVRTSPLFQHFQGAEKHMLAAKFGFLEAEADSVLINQGDRASGLFVLLSGHAEVLLDHGGQTKRLATLGPGDIFGEMSLLSNSDAIATVRATSKCFVLEMPGQEFRETIMTHPQVLMVVGDLADDRQRQYDAIVKGEADYDEGHLDLF